MTRTFLPLMRADGGIALPQTHSNAFVGGAPSLIADIHKNMAVSEANSEGRAPSPFARVWQFRRNLAGETGKQEKDRAVAAFRGILALFALRDYYHLKVEVDLTPPLAADPVDGDTPISRLFEVHATHLPQPADPAQARFLFGHRLVLFRLTEPGGAPATVFAGYSPLTLFYPAARSLERSRALSAIFWYDADARHWNDPSANAAAAQGRLSQEARAHLAAWLDQALDARVAGGQRLAVLDGARLSAEDDRFLTTLLSDWRKELKVTAAAGQIADAPLAKSPAMLDVERSEGRAFEIPAMLTRVYRGTGRPSDFAVRGNALVLTLDKAANPSQRIYGNVFGSREAAAALAAAPAEGDDLGGALGRPGEAPIPYVTLDRLFTPRLGRLQKGKNKVSDEWAALSLLDGSKLEGIFLLPYEPAILRYFSPQEIRDATRAENNIAAVQVSFRLEAEGLDVRRNYNEAGDISPLDPSLDLRFFPNFRLDLLADLSKQLPFPETDRNYYARLRLSPELERVPMRWLAADGTPLPNAAPYFEGNYDRPADRRLVALGRQAFWRLPMQTTPGAFQLAGFGFLLLMLNGSSQAGQTPRSWTVAVDFGTTNSCVAIDKGSGEVDAAYRLPVLTTTFLRTWETALRGDSDEGTSALADFMYWQNDATVVLNENEFFPTQILTRHRLDLRKLPYDKGFDERNGLAFFPNVSLAAVARRGFTDIIEGFEAMRSTEVKARFNLNRNLKWKDDSGDDSLLWRKVFHQHLRLQLLLTAANENAFVERLVASFPKAFIPDEVKDYKEALEEIWGSSTTDGFDPKIRKTATAIDVCSESAAAAATLEITVGQEFFLLDMGGGTTDIAVFKDNVLEEECSLTLAGRELEQYVCRSEGLRHQIARCFNAPEDRETAFARANQPLHVYQTLFQGFLLNGGGAKTLSDLAKRGQKDAATQGFFLSAVFLYTGLAYFCGLWLKRRRGSHGGITAEEHLQWLGNGSSFIRMLGVGDRSFEEIIVRMFNAACGGSAKIARLRPDAKTVVAKGLLRSAVVRSSEDEQQVFSYLLSDSISFGDHAWGADETLSGFYKQFTPDAAVAWDGLSEGKVFRQYLDALQTQLPLARFNKSPLVNLGVLGLPEIERWAVDYVAMHRAAVEKELFERLKENKDRWGGVLQTGSPDTLFVEPLFVSELAALLEQIRETYCA